jgi:hypothetical protein
VRDRPRSTATRHHTHRPMWRINAPPRGPPGDPQRRSTIIAAPGPTTADGLARGSPLAAAGEIHTNPTVHGRKESANDYRVAVRRSMSQPKTTRGRILARPLHVTWTAAPPGAPISRSGRFRWSQPVGKFCYYRRRNDPALVQDDRLLHNEYWPFVLAKGPFPCSATPAGGTP